MLPTVNLGDVISQKRVRPERRRGWEGASGSGLCAFRAVRLGLPLGGLSGNGEAVCGVGGCGVLEPAGTAVCVCGFASQHCCRRREPGEMLACHFQGQLETAGRSAVEAAHVICLALS